MPKSFIAKIAPIAQKLYQEGSPIFPSVRIAQSALETGWKIPSWNNLVGFKVGNGVTNQFWKGEYVNKGSWEVFDGQRTDIRANFRAYHSMEDSFRDQDLLFQISRYDRVRGAKTAQDQARMLQACGYATDPNYANKIITIMNQRHLLQYDQVRKDKEDIKNPGSSTTNPPVMYTIKKGDTLWDLAQNNPNFSVDDLLRWNPKIDPRRLQIGQKINISNPNSTMGGVFPLPSGYVRQGDRGEKVRQIQAALNAIGFSAGPVDGRFGPLTKAGLLRFQRLYANLNNNGIYGPNTRSRIQEHLNKL